MIYITSVISLTLILASFIKQDSKKIFYSIFIWMWVLFTFSYGTADYEMYLNLYEGNLYNKVEIGFTLMCQLFYKIGLPYQFFLGIYGAIGLFLIRVYNI